jgi:FtsH-binding integral membrane protein
MYQHGMWGYGIMVVVLACSTPSASSLYMVIGAGVLVIAEGLLLIQQQLVRNGELQDDMLERAMRGLKQL